MARVSYQQTHTSLSSHLTPSALTRVASPSASGDNTLSSSSVSSDNLENKSPVALGDTTPKGSPVVSGEPPEEESAIVSRDTTLEGKRAAQDKSTLKANIHKNPYVLAVDDFEGDSPGPSSRKLSYEDVLSQGGLNEEGIPLQRLSLPILPASIYKRITAEDFNSDPDTSTVDEMKWKKGKRKAKKGSNATVAGPSGTSTTQDQAPAAAITQAQVSTTAAASQVQDPATASSSQVQDPLPFTTITPAQASANAAANNAGVALATANVLAAVAASLASSSISSQANPTANSGDSGIPEPSMPEFCFPGYGDIPNITGEAQVWYTGVRHMLLWGVNDMNFADGKYKVSLSIPFRPFQSIPISFPPLPSPFTLSRANISSGRHHSLLPPPRLSQQDHVGPLPH